MRVYLLTLILFLSSCQTNSWRLPSNESDVIDVVFDLDWTLISKVDESYRGKENVLVVEDELYRVNDWTREIVTALHNNPRYRVSFFSGGPVLRNMDVLTQLKIMDGSGKSFSQIAYKKLHRHDITEVEPAADIENPTPADRWKKDLTKVNPDTNKVILIDDDHRHALNLRQRNSVLWTGKGFFHYESSIELDKARVDKPFNQFVPTSFQEWVLQRNKLALVYGILEKSNEEFDQVGGQLNKIIQENVEASGIERNLLKDSGKDLFNMGSAKLKMINGEAQKLAIDRGCYDLFTPFLRPPPL